MRSPSARRTRFVCGLSRAAFKDIDRCAEAIKPAKRSRIHTFLSTSPVHMKYKLQKEPQEVYEMVIAQVTRATTPTTWNGRARTALVPSTTSSTAASKRRSMPAPPRSTSPTPSATPCRKSISRSSGCCASACRTPTRRFSAHCHDDLGMAVRTRLPASAPASARSNAPSTASASAPATPRSRRW